MSDQPRRSTRTRAPMRRDEPEPSSSKQTRAAPKVPDADEQLRVLLEEPRSALTKADMSDIINLTTWTALSPAARTHLAAHLPRTAFRTHHPAVSPAHPAAPPAPSPSPPPCPDPTDLNPAVFTDAHTLAALRTWQDHLYTGWLTRAHADKLAAYEAGVRAGTLHAPWKDDAWAADNAPGPPGGAHDRAGEAGEWRLQDLVRAGVVKAGDVLAYRLRFAALGVVVEKDALIDDVQSTARSFSMTLLLPPGTTPHLPLSPDTADLREVDASSPSQIENAILDVDGRVGRAARPNGNAWKALTVWRAGEGDEENFVEAMEKGGRVQQGTLFYLRGCSYYDQ